MSAGTRKKLVDFQKMLGNGVRIRYKYIKNLITKNIPCLFINLIYIYIYL